MKSGAATPTLALMKWGVWRTVRNLWPNLDVNLDIKVGDGKRTKF